MFTIKSFALFVVVIMAMTSSVSAQIDPCVMNCMSQYQSCAMSCGGDFTCQGKCAQDQILCNQKCQMIKIQTLITDDKPVVATTNAIKPVDPQCLQNCANSYITCSTACGADFTCIQTCNTQAMVCDKSCGTFKAQAPIHNMVKAKVDPQCLQNCANSYITCSTACGADFTCIQNCNTQAMACDKSCGTFQATPIHNMAKAKVNPQCLQNCANSYISCSTGCGTDFTCIQNCNTQAMNCDKLCGTFKLQVQAQRNITGEIDDECSTCCGGCDKDFTNAPTCDDDKNCISVNKALRDVCYDECHHHNAKCQC